ncbi:hypothetical protein BVC80_8869g22 [Macleaya cordata]|uniref:Uncharacterized protein n=1 Tax=Macleaya cordata TaxID=56857 RepID=A0A200Q715_MACCD|nr:hypothetical protein BVC80_8869g22 [Macleaya cordata]
MAHQEDGWPLGLQPLNTIVGLVRNHDFSGSMSFNTLITCSPSSSTVFSSDLDTESTGSFFHEQSITLGSLMGVSSILDLSGRSLGGRRSVESFRGNNKKTTNNNLKSSKTWFFSLCSKPNVHDHTEITVKNPPLSTLAHFLEVERRAANDYRTNQSPIIYEQEQFYEGRPVSEPNSLFIDGCIAPPQQSPCFSSSSNVNGGDKYGFPVLFSCICGTPRN